MFAASGEQQLANVCSQLFARNLDREKPVNGELCVCEAQQLQQTNSGESGSAYVTGGGYIPPPAVHLHLQKHSPNKTLLKTSWTCWQCAKQQSTVGDRCSLNTECMLGAYCNGNSQPPTCQCLSTHVNVNDSVRVIFPVKKAVIMTCSAPPLTLAPDAFNRQCVCPPGSRLLRTCVSVHAWPGEQCNQSNPIPACSGQSYCSDHGVLWLPPPLIIYQKQCVARPRLQCPYPTIKLQFASRTPNVPQFFVLDNSVSVLGKGAPHSECVSVLPLDSTLENNTCSRLNPSHSNTPTYRSINSECMGADRCSGGSICRNSGAVVWMGGSNCHLGTCQCPPGHRLLANTCILAISNPGQSCQSGERCANGSVCRFGVCMCLSDYHVGSGDKCEKISTKKSSIKHSSTSSEIRHKAMASQPKQEPKKMVLSTSKPGNLCLHGEACTGGSVCNKQGYCSCAEEEIIIEDKCVSSNGEASRLLKGYPSPHLDSYALTIPLAPVTQCAEPILPVSRRIHPIPRRVPWSSIQPRPTCQQKPRPAVQPPKQSSKHGFNRGTGTAAMDSIPAKNLVPGAMCQLSLVSL
uniref:EGF-like domain-containing protein n=1 Tax=Ditylenchus dipsaci TaxID=166011 RepID=A0A915E8F7_9BILA